MFIIKRNQILVLTLAIMVAFAGYLNYNEKRIEQDYLLNETLSIDLVPSSSIIENYNNSTSLNSDNEKNNNTSDKENNSPNNDVEENTDEIGLATFVEVEEDDFFLEAKLNRDETREERKEWLMELINTVAIPDTKKEDAMNEIISIQDKLEKENQIESLIESKGFGNTYVRIDNDGVDVVVDKQNLSQNEISQITDIVKRVADSNVSNLKISSYKKDN